MHLDSSQAEALWGWLAERGLVTPTPAMSEFVLDAAPRSSARPRVLFVADGAPAENGAGLFTTEEGELLSRMVAAMKLAPAEVVYANPARAAAKMGELEPETMVILGAAAMAQSWQTGLAFQATRGTFQRREECGAAPVLVTFHPRDLLKNPTFKRLAWADLQLVMEHLCLPKPG